MQRYFTINLCETMFRLLALKHVQRFKNSYKQMLLVHIELQCYIVQMFNKSNTTYKI